MPAHVKLAERYTAGDRAVGLYQAGTYGSCLCSLRSRLVWPTQGNFISKGVPRPHQARLFNGGTHRTAVFPEAWTQSPLLTETFLHIQTWHARFPQFHKEQTLELNATYASMVGLRFHVDTFLKHHWSVDVEWTIN